MSFGGKIVLSTKVVIHVVCWPTATGSDILVTLTNDGVYFGPFIIKRVFELPKLEELLQRGIRPSVIEFLRSEAMKAV
ncbi:MAG: hypothetical protein CMJ64_21065 [Planctomycetaceae bacterium]|nr:hypothetical protein [Planctomycetaceae bacterium]